MGLKGPHQWVELLAVGERRGLDSSQNHSLLAWRSNEKVAAPGEPGGLPTDVLVRFQTLLTVRQVHCETQHHPIVLLIHTLNPFLTTARTITLDLERAPQSTPSVQFKRKTVPEFLHL